LLVAAAIRYRKSGRQRHDQDRVICPLCSFGHRHRAPVEGEEGYTRPAPCRRSQRYRVEIKTVPAVVLEPGRRENELGVAGDHELGVAGDEDLVVTGDEDLVVTGDEDLVVALANSEIEVSANHEIEVSATHEIEVAVAVDPHRTLSSAPHRTLSSAPHRLEALLAIGGAR
jgi:hypothetical protein